jgi:phosphoribosylamine--glycine ligase
MLTEHGPKVIEYNCRFGDPETQVVLPLLERDLLTVMQATTNGTLDRCEVKFSDAHSACVVMASRGYPAAYDTGFAITIPEKEADSVFIAGAKQDGDTLVTSGGRVLGVTKVAPTLREALDAAYRAVGEIQFENAFYRRDIGARALAAEEG